MLRYPAFAILLCAELVFSAGYYNYKLNGADWGNTNSLCSKGLAQSPIDLKDSVAWRSETIKIRGFNYPDNVVQTLVRDGANSVTTDTHAEFQVTFDDGEKESFFPLQYHLHSPSEHTVNGEYFDLELHIVHVNAEGTPAAVIGFLFDVSNHTMAHNYDLDLLLPRVTDNS